MEYWIRYIVKEPIIKAGSCTVIIYDVTIRNI